MTETLAQHHTKSHRDTALSPEEEKKCHDASANHEFHCPINSEGEKSSVHIQQVNLEDNAYISDMYVGNPPQKIRALFDTGSTNTWVLNKNVKLAGNADKELSYDDGSSCSAVKLA
jgi:hypothetical protein